MRDQLKYLLKLFFVLASFQVFSQLEKVEAHYEQLEKQDEPVTLSFIQEDSNLVADFSRLSQIILIRHGEPAMKHKGWKKRSEAKQYIKTYDSVGVFSPSFIPLKLQPNELSVIHTSSMQRSVSTAEQVFELDELMKPDPIFREFERKIFLFPNIKLPHGFWMSGSRGLWFLGINDKNVESRNEAIFRAKIAANFLNDDALQNGKTLLVSHGLLNRYLEKYLKKLGWKSVYNGGNGYLSQRMLVKYN